MYAKLWAILFMVWGMHSLAGVPYTTIAKVGISLYVGYAIITALVTRETRREFVSSWKGFRWWMVPFAMTTFAAVVLVGLFLDGLSPYLSQGWTHYVFGTSINIIAAPIELISGGAGATSGSVAATGPRSLKEPLLITGFLLTLLMVLPSFARGEEVQFRKGRLTWWPITKASIGFGLIHMVVGIPPAFAIALSIAGFAFAFLYKQSHQQLTSAGVEASAADTLALDLPASAHAVYNSLLILLFIVVTWLPE